MSIRTFTTRLPLSTALRPALPTAGAAAVLSSKNISSQNKPYDVPYDPNEATHGAAPIGTKDTKPAFRKPDTSYTGASSAHSAKSAAAEAASNVAESSSRTADDAAHTASRAASSAQHTASRAADQAGSVVEDLTNKFHKSGKSDVGSGSSRGVPGQTGNPVYDAADRIGQSHSKSTKNPSVLSSGGAVGSKFNPDGPIGNIAEKIGGPFARDGVIGRQFDAAGGGIAGTVEKLVDGPSQKKPGDAGYKGPASGSKK